MFSLSVALDGPVIWALMFKTKEAAEKAWNSIAMLNADPGNVVVISDDFGQRVLLTLAKFIGAVLEDLSLTRLAHIERYLHEARTRAKAQQDAHADPVLRTAAMAQGPSMISPMGNGPFPRN
jgi:hypothetical protein